MPGRRNRIGERDQPRHQARQLTTTGQPMAGDGEGQCHGGCIGPERQQQAPGPAPHHHYVRFESTVGGQQRAGHKEHHRHGGNAHHPGGGKRVPQHHSGQGHRSQQIENRVTPGGTWFRAGGDGCRLRIEPKVELRWRCHACIRMPLAVSATARSVFLASTRIPIVCLVSDPLGHISAGEMPQACWDATIGTGRAEGDPDRMGR